MQKRRDTMIKFEEIYNNAIKATHNLVDDIRFKRNLNMNHIMDCVEQICQYLGTQTNIFILLNNVQNKNPYLYSHPVNVAFLSYEIGKWINLTNYELQNLVCAGLLHDIGKAKIRDSLLNKPEKLSENEMSIVRTHPIIGYRILESLNMFDSEVLLGVLHHHERIDGSGYPMGLQEYQISLFGRIIAIADIFDAITSTKAYHIKSSPFKAVEEIEDSGFGYLDPFVCQIFLNNIINYYYGSVVLLSNEQVGEVVYINPEEKTKPLIRCENEYHNLSKERNLEIVEIVEIVEKVEILEPTS